MISKSIKFVSFLSSLRNQDAFQWKSIALFPLRMRESPEEWHVYDDGSRVGGGGAALLAHLHVCPVCCCTRRRAAHGKRCTGRAVAALATLILPTLLQPFATPPFGHPITTVRVYSSLLFVFIYLLNIILLFLQPKKICIDLFTYVIINFHSSLNFIFSAVSLQLIWLLVVWIAAREGTNSSPIQFQVSFFATTSQFCQLLHQLLGKVYTQLHISLFKAPGDRTDRFKQRLLVN